MHTLLSVESPAVALILGKIEDLAERGLFMQAHALAAELGDYRSWRGPAAMALAARLVGHMGAPRLADALAYLGYRRYPQAAETRLRYARFLLARRGQYRAWQFFQQLGDWQPEVPALRAEWLSLKSYLYALLRDFSRSAELRAEVSACALDDPWLQVEQSYCLEQEDRYAQALQLCEQVLHSHPHYRSALVQAVQLQFQLNQNEAALTRLRAAAGVLESAGLCAQLVEYLIEHEQLDEALHWLERTEQLQPLREKHPNAWFAARRCDIACLRGDYALALSLAEAAGGPFYTQLRTRLETPQGVRRVLPVNFVRQHHMTCVPATLSALSAYWGRPVAHLEVAEEICYDGTSHQAERAWAERNGWRVAEFTVDWDTCRALIDRGLPFTLSMQYTGSGHLQAVVGYDEPRGSLLIRDPAQAQFAECLAERLFATQRASGPRGMLLLPPEEAHRLEGVELPEQALWDSYYQVMSALEAHRRDEAWLAFETMRVLAPQHRLSLQAQRAMGWYDGRESEVLESTEALLALDPDDANLILSKASSLAQLQSRERQLAWLDGHCQARWNEPGIAVRYAELLRDDGRMASQAQRLLDRVLRQVPTQAQAWSALASERWNEGLREEACELYRLAACLHGTQEGYSGQYFRALRCLGRSEEGIAFLQARQRRLGPLAAGSTLTLSDFLEELGRSDEACALLENAVELRPRDAELLLNLADFHGRHGEPEKSWALLQRAEPLSRRSTWLRALVVHHQRSGGDVQQVLGWCQETAEMEPLNLSGQRLLVQLLKQTAGEEAADAHVDALALRFEHHMGIAELQVEHATRRSLADGEQALRRLLASHPQHAWALRELAVCLARLGRRDEALEQCGRGREIDPYSSSGYSTLGFVLLQDGQREAAREAFREAVRLSADNDYASGVLVDSSAHVDEARQSLAFIHGELVRQVTFGDGWLAYQQQAQSQLDGETLREQLCQALQQRPDLWQLWVVVARQHAVLDCHAQAETVLRDAIERFPLLPRLALEQAQLQKSQGQLAECRATLQDSFRISPLWTASVSLYVDCLIEEGDRLSEAEQLLRSVLARAPDNSELRAYLAYVLGEQALYVYAADEAERVLREEPGNAWAWNQLRRYSAALKEEQRPLNLARELVQRRAGDVEAWLALAEQETDVAAKEQALREALRYDPRHRGVNGQLLELLLNAGRYPALRELLDAPCWAGAAPVRLALFGPRARYADGQREQAITELRHLLSQYPGSYEGWRELADWHDSAGEPEAYLAAAREMVRLEPKVAVAHGYLAHALLLGNQLSEALPVFSSAFRLDPAYLFAGFNEFDLLRHADNHKAAGEVLERLLQASSEPPVWQRALRQAMSTGDQALKRRALEALSQDPRAQEAWRNVMSDYPYKDKLLREVLNTGILQGTLHSEAVGYWLRLEDGRWWPNSLARAFKKALDKDPLHAAKQAMLELLAERQNASALLTRTLHACRQAMGEDGATWGVASYAMLNHGRHRQMFDLLSDWRRPDVPVYALDNLAVALRIHARDQEAAAVSRHSLERQPDNHEAQVWLGFDAALAGDLDALDPGLESLAAVELRPFYGSLLRLLQGYAAAVRQGDSEVARVYFQRGKELLHGSVHPAFKRLLKTLCRDLAYGPATPRWLRPIRYLQLRFG